MINIFRLLWSNLADDPMFREEDETKVSRYAVLGLVNSVKSKVDDKLY
jgi:hypothetical protein